MKELLQKIIGVAVILMLFVGPFLFSKQETQAAGTVLIFLTTTGVNTWTVPSDWTSVNTIEVVGGGGGGSNGTAGAGGGGGAYSKISNLSLTPGNSVTYQVGTGGAAGTSGNDTFFNRTAGSGNSCADTTSVCAKGGGPGTGVTAGTGGAAGSGTGTTKTSGGNGGGGAIGSGGGGGGAGGLTASGGAGAGSDGAGGAGESGVGGSAGAASGGNGGVGKEWDATHGSGGGGGGKSAGTAGSGGNYGGAGGGGTTAGVGAQGIIAITYDTAAVSSPPRSVLTFGSDTQFKSSLTITGNISKGSGTFLIDHPLDPSNKLLFHSFVESPDAKNIYDGIAMLDQNGSAVIRLPSYFDALNGEVRYQFAPLGQAMPNLHVGTIESVNKFTIVGGVPGGKVSWQVTGVRHDPYILKNPIPNEVPKGPDQPVNKGECLYQPICR